MDRDFILRPLMIRCAIGIVQSAYPKWSVHNCVAATENGKNDVLRKMVGPEALPRRVQSNFENLALGCYIVSLNISRSNEASRSQLEEISL